VYKLSSYCKQFTVITTVEGVLNMKNNNKSKDIKVNLHFNKKGESLQKIIERNVQILATQAKPLQAAR